MQSCGTYFVWRWAPAEASWINEVRGNLTVRPVEPELADLLREDGDGAPRGFMPIPTDLPYTSGFHSDSVHLLFSVKDLIPAVFFFLSGLPLQSASFRCRRQAQEGRSLGWREMQGRG